MKKNIGQKLALYICPIRTISSDVQEYTFKIEVQFLE